MENRTLGGREEENRRPQAASPTLTGGAAACRRQAPRAARHCSGGLPMPGVVSKADVRSGAAGANRERPCLYTQGPHFCLHTPPRPEIHAQNRYLGFFSTLFYHGPAPSHAMSTSGDERHPPDHLLTQEPGRARARVTPSTTRRCMREVGTVSWTPFSSPSGQN